MAGFIKKTNFFFLSASLISAVLAAIITVITTGNTATAKSVVLVPTSDENIAPQIDAKNTLTIDDSQPSTIEVEFHPNLAVTPPENTTSSSSQPINTQDQVNSSTLPQFNSLDLDDTANNQVTSVSQLTDIQPTDWAFQALQSLIERYGCIGGYPNGTYQGNSSLTRYQFAAGLDTCLEQIRKLITTSTSNFVATEDLTTVERLKSEFSTELEALTKKVDTLEARTEQIQANQFSTTTKLFGNVRFQANNFFSGEGNPQANFQYNTFLGLISSFTGRDLLITGLASTNTDLPELITNNAGRNVGSTREGTSDTASSGSTDNLLRMITLSYQFPVNDKLTVSLVASDRYRFNPISLPRFLPYYSVGSGPVTAFAEAPPVYLLGAGSGISLIYKIFDATELSLTYLATFGNDPNSGSGLFKSDYIAAAQINYNPSSRFFLQGLYQHGYFGTSFGSIGNFAFNSAQFFRGNGFVGSALANRFDDAGVFFNEASKVSSNAYLIGGYYAITPKFILGGWANLINARLLGKGDANIWTYSVQAAFPDLFKQGNLGGLVVGMEPTLTGLRIGGNFVGGFENDTSLHIEAYYKHQLTTNISLTPSLLWITSPNQDNDNEDLIIGGVRTTFSF